MKDGFVKVAAASPMIKVADAEYNAGQIIACMHEAERLGVKILVFPELVMTGCSARDLMSHSVILDGARDALCKVIAASKGVDMLMLVGLPFANGARIYSCAAAVCDGELLALVPRENVKNSIFAAPDKEASYDVIFSKGIRTILSTDLILQSNVLQGLAVSVEVGEDSYAVVPPSARHSQAGATVICRLAGFPATLRSTKREELALRYRSKNMCSGIILAAPGKGESSTDNVYSGLCAVAENGEILAKDEGENSLAASELDIDHLINLRRRVGAFDTPDRPHDYLFWGSELKDTALTRSYRAEPQLPERAEDMAAYCERMLDIQVSGLVKRMEYAGLTHCVVGISGGVDSSLALMVCAMAVKKMGLPAKNVVACTIPCFGTSSRTKANAVTVAEQCGAEVRVIDISKTVLSHFDDIGHAHDDYSIAFENAQARERTQVLMDIANKINGLNVGTEDLSEYIDGWCTYNGDHISNYDVNVGLTKTQVRATVSYIASSTEDELLAATLRDVLDCPVSPELLPIKDDKIKQKTEETVGPYSLQDFYTHMMLFRGFRPRKTIRLAKIAFGGQFSDEELKKWMLSYCKRLVSQQFKRSCLMDGPAVEEFSVSPRNGWLIPSDAECALFLKELEEF